MAAANRNRNAIAPVTPSAVKILQQLHDSGEPIVLDINGQAKLLVKDTTSYQKLLELADRLECIEVLRDGLKEAKEGKCVSLEQAKETLLKKHGIPS